MLRNSVLIALLVLAACSHQQDITSTGSGAKEAGNCEPICEHEAKYSIIRGDKGGLQTKLDADEQKSLQKSMDSVQAHGGSNLHIEAKAVDGRLVFSPDSSAKHISQEQMSIIADSGDPKAARKTEQLVATPEAMKILERRH
jgi:hypothetical protein